MFTAVSSKVTCKVSAVILSPDATFSGKYWAITWAIPWKDDKKNKTNKSIDMTDQQKVIINAGYDE